MILHQQLRLTAKKNEKLKTFWQFEKDKTSLNIGLNDLVLTKILNDIQPQI